jgi:hypothetical protein
LGKINIRRMGQWAAFVAAYALVFNVMLTSALLAAISPTELNAQHQLCLNGVSKKAPGEDNRVAPIVTCPICLSGVAAAADLPPQSPALAIRLALYLPFETPRHDAVVVGETPRSHKPRGPPFLS